VSAVLGGAVLTGRCVVCQFSSSSFARATVRSFRVPVATRSPAAGRYPGRDEPVEQCRAAITPSTGDDLVSAARTRGRGLEHVHRGIGHLPSQRRQWHAGHSPLAVRGSVDVFSTTGGGWAGAAWAARSCRHFSAASGLPQSV